MAATASFPAHLLSMSERNGIGQKEMRHLFDLVVLNGGWENSMVRGKKLDFLKLANVTIHAVTGPMNKYVFSFIKLFFSSIYSH